MAIEIVVDARGLIWSSGIPDGLFYHGIRWPHRVQPTTAVLYLTWGSSSPMPDGWPVQLITLTQILEPVRGIHQQLIGTTTGYACEGADVDWKIDVEG